MKKMISTVLVVIIFLVGISIMLYPFISSMINNLNSRNNAEVYFTDDGEIDNSQLYKQIEEAQQYNKNMVDGLVLTDPFDPGVYEKMSEEYQNLLVTGSNGIMAYVDIPKIDVLLPIYHGTSDEVLQNGAGHLQNTSFPVGGESTHSVISAHTAYPTDTFFDYLTDLVIGDEFYIRIKSEILKYEVDQIKVVEPTNAEDLRVIDGKDHITLLTCTPYAINSHRLLVRGVRVEYDESEEEIIDNGRLEAITIIDDTMFVFGVKVPLWLAITISIAFATLVVVIVFLILKKKRKKDKE